MVSHYFANTRIKNEVGFNKNVHIGGLSQKANNLPITVT
jgi:hypothetical protein